MGAVTDLRHLRLLQTCREAKGRGFTAVCRHPRAALAAPPPAFPSVVQERTCLLEAQHLHPKRDRAELSAGTDPAWQGPDTCLDGGSSQTAPGHPACPSLHGQPPPDRRAGTSPGNPAPSGQGPAAPRQLRRLSQPGKAARTKPWLLLRYRGVRARRGAGCVAAVPVTWPRVLARLAAGWLTKRFAGSAAAASCPRSDKQPA